METYALIEEQKREQFMSLTCELLTGLLNVFPECEDTREMVTLFQQMVMPNPSAKILFMNKWHTSMMPYYPLLLRRDIPTLIEVTRDLTEKGEKIGVTLLNYTHPCVLIAKLRVLDKVQDVGFDDDSKQYLMQYMLKMTELTLTPSEIAAFGDQPIATVTTTVTTGGSVAADPPGVNPLDMFAGKIPQKMIDKATRIAERTSEQMQNGEFDLGRMDLQTLSAMGQEVIEGLDEQEMQQLFANAGTVFSDMVGMFSNPQMQSEIGQNPQLGQMLGGLLGGGGIGTTQSRSQDGNTI